MNSFRGMKNKDITKEQYSKLIDCELFNPGNKEPRRVKFLNRGRQFVNVVIVCADGTYLISSVSCYSVYVGGKRLPYKDRYSLTNRNKPF